MEVMEDEADDGWWFKCREAGERTKREEKLDVLREVPVGLTTWTSEMSRSEHPVRNGSKAKVETAAGGFQRFGGVAIL